jgi:hypothetical protein
MIIYQPPKIYKEGTIKTVIKYAWFPVFVKTSTMNPNFMIHYPTLEKSLLIWLEKYVNTYTYYKSNHSWVLRKTERLSEYVIKNLKNNMYNIGFTGTRQGMTEEQFRQLSILLKTFINEEPCNFFHGQCIGADCEAAELASELGYSITAHPGYLPKNPQWKGSRGNFSKNTIILPEKPFLIRDHDIVDASDVLIATPAQKDETIRSGTWTTIRYGAKTKFVIIIFPDGSINIINGN